MDHISKIIFDVLASGSGINLPEVGALYVEREAAKFIGKNEIKPPANRVVFSRKQGEQFDSIIDLMVAGGQQRAQAEQEYAEWLAKASGDKGLFEINEVGVVKQGFFYPSAALHDKLNPGDQRNVKLKGGSGGGKKWLIALLILLAAAAVAFAVYYFCLRDKETPVVKPPVEQSTPQETPESGMAQGDEFPDEQPKGTQGGDSASFEPEGTQPTQGEESAPESGSWVEREKPAEQNDTIIVEELSWWQKFLNIFRCGDNKRKPRIIIEEPAQPELERVEVPTDNMEEPGNDASGEDEVIAAPSGYTYHVVVGVFSAPNNSAKVCRGHYV